VHGRESEFALQLKPIWAVQSCGEKNHFVFPEIVVETPPFRADC